MRGAPWSKEYSEEFKNSSKETNSGLQKTEEYLKPIEDVKKTKTD